MRRIALLIAFASIIVACGPIVPAVAPLDGVTLTLVAEGLEEPAWLTAPPGDARRLFVLERFGRIRVIEDGVLLDAQVATGLALRQCAASPFSSRSLRSSLHAGPSFQPWHRSTASP